MNSHALLLSPTLNAAHSTSSTLPRKVHSTPSPLRKVQVFICVYIIYIYKMVCLTKTRRKAYLQQYYQSNRSEALSKKKDNYKFNADTRKQACKHRCQEKIKNDKQLFYAKNADKMKGTKVHNPRAILSLLKFVSSA